MKVSVDVEIEEGLELIARWVGRWVVDRSVKTKLMLNSTQVKVRFENQPDNFLSSFTSGTSFSTLGISLVESCSTASMSSLLVS